MSTATETNHLSKDDLKALRIADDVYARHCNGASRFEAIVRGNRLNDLFCQDSDSRRIIPVSHTFTNFRKSGIPHSSGDFTAVTSSFGGHYGLEWQTIVSLLRADDEVVLDWIAGNNCGYLEAAQGQFGNEPCRHSFSGLHHDMLALVVRRGERDKYRFHLTDSICPNNSARMIRSA